MLTWAMAALLGGLAGILSGPNLTFTAGFLSFGAGRALLPGFMAAVLAGMRSMPGAVAGGLTVGVVEQMGTLSMMIEIPGARAMLLFGFLLVVLMVQSPRHLRAPDGGCGMSDATTVLPAVPGEQPEEQREEHPEDFRPGRGRLDRPRTGVGGAGLGRARDPDERALALRGRRHRRRRGLARGHLRDRGAVAQRAARLLRADLAGPPGVRRGGRLRLRLHRHRPPAELLPRGRGRGRSSAPSRRCSWVRCRCA